MTIAGLATYLINLDRAPERLATMAGRLDALGLPWARVPAVDGRQLSFPHPGFSDAGYRVLHGRARTPAEIGCYFSHVDCARRLLETDNAHALIVEDDVVFAPDFVPALQAALAAAGDWDILRLSTVNTGRKFTFRSLTPGRALGIALTREKGAGAYVINRRAAQWFVTGLMPMRLAFDIAFDTEYLAGLSAAFVTPPPTEQNVDAPTQIQANIRAYRLSRWRYLTVMPYRAWLEIARLLLRGARLARLRLRGRAGVTPGAGLSSRN